MSTLPTQKPQVIVQDWASTPEPQIRDKSSRPAAVATFAGTATAVPRHLLTREVVKGCIGDVFSLDQDFGQYDGLYPITAGNNANGKPKRSDVASGGGVILPGVTASGKTNSVYVEDNYAGAAYGFGAAPDKAFVYDASYVKLREVILGYSLPHKLLEGTRSIKGIQLSLIGRNLWIIHKNLPYADPETGTSFGNISGFQSGAYPSVREFAFNVKVSF